MRALHIPLLLMLLLPLNGCLMGVKEDFLKDDFQKDAVSIPYRVVKVVVKDARPRKAAKDIQVPNLYLKNRNETAEIDLSAEQKVLIESETIRYFLGKGPSIIIRAEMLKGTQSFTSKTMSERESVDCEIKLTLIDVASGQPFYFAIGSASTYMQSMNASKEYLEKLFQKAIRVSIYKAAEQLSKVSG